MQPSRKQLARASFHSAAFPDHAERLDEPKKNKNPGPVGPIPARYARIPGHALILWVIIPDEHGEDVEPHNIPDVPCRSISNINQFGDDPPSARDRMNSSDG